MIREELHPASYRGVPFKVTSAGVAGGRKDSKKEFVNSDRQLIEDLGLRQRSFTVSGIVAAQVASDGTEIRSYLEVRKALLDALEKGGTGVLVHPFFGRIENVACRTFSLNESITSLGESPIEISFEISNTTGVPQVKENVLGSVTSANSAVTVAAGADVADQFEATPGFIGNFTDAVTKVDDFVTDVRAATDPAAVLAGELDDFSNEVSVLSRDVTALVGSAQELSDSVLGVFNTMNGLYASVDATFDAFGRLFDYGDLDVGFPQDTAGRIERQKNRDVLNGNVQALALSYAYLNGVQMDLATVEDVNAAAVVLEDQFQKLKVAEVLDSSVEEELTKQRIAADKFFQDQRSTKPRVIEVQTNLTSARILSYLYYGDSSRGQEIAELNGLIDSAFVEGTVKVLTS